MKEDGPRNLKRNMRVGGDMVRGSFVRNEIEHIIEGMSPVELAMLQQRGMHIPERVLLKAQDRLPKFTPRREAIRLGEHVPIPGNRTQIGLGERRPVDGRIGRESGKDAAGSSIDRPASTGRAS